MVRTTDRSHLVRLFALLTGILLGAMLLTPAPATAIPAQPFTSSISPSSGSTSGGQSVSITGLNFTGATSVHFGAAAATSFTVNSDTLITAISPAGSGTVSVTVTTPDGTSTAALTFQYVDPPTVTSLTPNTGSTAGANGVTIHGTGFGSTTAVMFGNVQATSFTVFADSLLSVIAPPHAAGLVYVTVTNAAETSALDAAAEYTYVAAANTPVVTSVDPNTGVAGTQVAIHGSGFLTATSVHFGAPLASFAVENDTLISAVAPSGTGTVDVTVTNPDGISAASASDQYTYSLPTITSISPTSGTSGTSVTIHGTHLLSVTAVHFGPALSTFFLASDDNTMTAEAPGGSGTVDITVTNPEGTSTTSANDQFTYLSTAPTITSISPTSGTSGTSVTIHGTHLSSVTSVHFGVPVSTFFSASDDNTMTAEAPSGTGTVDITVTNPDGTSATSANDQFTYLSTAPTITSISPTSGTVGTLVTIHGTHLSSVTSVHFGVPVSTFFSASDDNTMTAEAPSGTGTVDITVTNPDGTSATSANDQFTYNASAPTITDVNPDTGPTSGGTAVGIYGTNLDTVTAVYFGTVSVQFNVSSQGLILTHSPAGTGEVDVTVVNPSGTSATTGADRFIYVAPAPDVNNIQPNSGSTGGGTTVTLNGFHLSGATSVKFGSNEATSFTVNSDNVITAVSPAGAGTVNVSVTSPGGTSMGQMGTSFTYVTPAAPIITAISPSSGPAAGGTSVTLTGTNFTGATSVSFGIVSATSFTVNSAESITVTSPAHPAGNVSVTVTTPGGTSNGALFNYVAAAPVITSINPTSGTALGGTTVIITGTNFTNTRSVVFDTLPANGFSVNSDTQITATSPAHTPGAVNLYVAGLDGTSNTVTYTYLSAAPIITAISPTTGTKNGGTLVTITGTNFTGATSVKFGTTASTSFVVTSATSINATSPAHAPGNVAVTVTTPGGTSNGATFNYVNASVPSNLTLSPNHGPQTGGTTVSVSGSNLSGVTQITVDGVSVPFTYSSRTGCLTFVTPAHAPGLVKVVVTTPAGSATVGYTYDAVPAPHNLYLSPTHGPQTGGTSVKITGSNTAGAQTVKVDGVSVPFSYAGSAIVFTAPAHAPGTVQVTVTTGTGTGSVAYKFDAVPPPHITSVSPSKVSTNGSDLVTVSGTNFAGVTSVTIGGVSVLFKVVNGCITFSAPAHAAGNVQIVVTTPAGSSAPAQLTYVQAKAPKITSLNPGTVKTSGGSSVTISGTALEGATTVKVNGVSVAFTQSGGSGGATLKFTAPAHSSGHVSVVVTTPAGTSSSATLNYTSSGH